MRLALNLRYLGPAGMGSDPRTLLALMQEAERLGYSVTWVAEAFSSDAPSLVGWLAGQSTRIDVGTAVMQIPARTPVATAMTAMTLDLVSCGRFRLGLGVSGPQVSEGWHGVRFSHPIERTREYVDIVRLTLRRETVRYDGEHFPLPLPDGPGKSLRINARPYRPAVPVYLGAVGPRNTRLAGEIADGWLSVFFQPDFAGEHLAELRAGRELAGRSLDGFDIVAMVPVVVRDDPADRFESVRLYTANFVGGFGSREANYYNNLAVRMGYGDAARQMQDLYLGGKPLAAAAAVPEEFLHRTALLGPIDRIVDGLQALSDVGVTTLAVTIFPDDLDDGIHTLRATAEALDKAGVGE